MPVGKRFIGLNLAVQLKNMTVRLDARHIQQKNETLITPAASELQACKNERGPPMVLPHTCPH